MRAILLASGYGTRLRPLTEKTPKCLLPVNGKPLLEIWLERLGACGVAQCLVNTHYLHRQVEQFVEASRYRDTVTLTYEPELLGTAGTLIANRQFFNGEDGLLIHADNYCLADFRAFIRAHRDRPRGCVMTMMTFRTETPSSCGIVKLDDHGVVREFHEKVPSPPGNLANGAVYCLSHEAIAEIAKRQPDAKDFSNDVIPGFLGRIYSHETTETFLDIGTPKTYAQANGRAIN